VLTFRLREGVEWHDGTPLTAADAAFTYERSGRTPFPVFDNVDNIETVETRDRTSK
jgi:peptide/nickel transport system substrate-binding protein